MLELKYVGKEIAGMKKLNIQKIMNTIRFIGTRTIAMFLNIPIALRRAVIKIHLASDRAFLRDAQEDVESFSTESKTRHKRMGRQEYTNVLTMEIDSRMILAMDELKEIKKRIAEKEAKLSNLSYK